LLHLLTAACGTFETSTNVRYAVRFRPKRTSPTIAEIFTNFLRRASRIGAAIQQSQLIERRGSTGSSSRSIAPGPSIQFRWLIIFALGPVRRVDARPQARETCIGLRLKVREHLLIVSFDLGENFIDPRKHSAENLDHLATQGVELDAQLLYVPLALFTATVGIAQVPPSYPTSSWNCSNSPRKFSGGPLVPSLITGVMV